MSGPRLVYSGTCGTNELSIPLMESSADENLSEVDLERTALRNDRQYPWGMHRVQTACSSWLRTPLHLPSHWFLAFCSLGYRKWLGHGEIIWHIHTKVPEIHCMCQSPPFCSSPEQISISCIISVTVALLLTSESGSILESKDCSF